LLSLQSPAPCAPGVRENLNWSRSRPSCSVRRRCRHLPCAPGVCVQPAIGSQASVITGVLVVAAPAPGVCVQPGSGRRRPSCRCSGRRSFLRARRACSRIGSQASKSCRRLVIAALRARRVRAARSGRRRPSCRCCCRRSFPARPACACSPNRRRRPSCRCYCRQPPCAPGVCVRRDQRRRPSCDDAVVAASLRARRVAARIATGGDAQSRACGNVGSQLSEVQTLLSLQVSAFPPAGSRRGSHVSTLLHWLSPSSQHRAERDRAGARVARAQGGTVLHTPSPTLNRSPRPARARLGSRRCYYRSLISSHRTRAVA
jgi:hypothetical protein